MGGGSGGGVGSVGCRLGCPDEGEDGVEGLGDAGVLPVAAVHEGGEEGEGKEEVGGPCEGNGDVGEAEAQAQCQDAAAEVAPQGVVHQALPGPCQSSHSPAPLGPSLHPHSPNRTLCSTRGPPG